MLNSSNFYINLKKNNKNIKKTEKFFQYLKRDIENSKIPLLESYKKKYVFNFSSKTIKKFSRYSNIIIIGMGGSVLGTKSIYSFFKKKINKNIFFLII